MFGHCPQDRGSAKILQYVPPQNLLIHVPESARANIGPDRALAQEGIRLPGSACRRSPLPSDRTDRSETAPTPPGKRASGRWRAKATRVACRVPWCDRPSRGLRPRSCRFACASISGQSWSEGDNAIDVSLAAFGEFLFGLRAVSALSSSIASSRSTSPAEDWLRQLFLQGVELILPCLCVCDERQGKRNE